MILWIAVIALSLAAVTLLVMWLIDEREKIRRAHDIIDLCREIDQSLEPLGGHPVAIRFFKVKPDNIMLSLDASGRARNSKRTREV